MRIRPDLVLYNGNVHTMDARKPRAQAVVVHRDHIAFVGMDDQVRELLRPGVEAINLNRRTVVPGFIDAHVHFAGYCLGLQRVELDGCKSVEEALARIEAKAKGLKPGQWLQGWGWNHNDWAVPEFPRKEMLDRIVPNNPAVMTRKDGHSIWVNTTALKLAGVTRDTPQPDGGQIDKDPQTGEPTGTLREAPAMHYVYDVVPKPTPLELQEALKEGLRRINAMGIVGIHDADGSLEDSQVFAALQSLQARGELSARIFYMLPFSNLDDAIRLGLRTGFGSEFLRFAGIKLFADGSLGSATALMLEPFLGQPNNYGVAIHTKDELRDMVRRATNAGLATFIHAIGDKANRDALDIYQEIPRHGLRCRIEHVQILHPNDIPRFAQLNVIASMQPIHATSDMYAADRLWGAPRNAGAYAWRSLLQAGARLALGSDCPVEPMDILPNIYAAVTRRRTNGEPPKGWYPEQCLTVAEAVRGFTIDAAYASGEEAIKGSLTPGKLADIVVLNEDIFTMEATRIWEAKVDYTICGGKILYQREK